MKRSDTIGMCVFRGIATASCLLTLSVACVTIPEPPRVDIKSDDYYSLANIVSRKTPDFDDLAKRGPFRPTVRRDFKIRVSQNELINSDLYISSHGGKAPLVIFQHGNLGDKDFHAIQAERVASWGMHALVVEQPNVNRWLKNGETLAQLVRLLRKWPELLDHKFDADNIILAGHSFGGSAIAIAAGLGAPVKGLIFLDPALYHKNVMYYIRKIKVPAILLGADTRVFKSRYRQYFYDLFPQNIVEISIRGATHNDAQYPNQFFLAESLGIESPPSPVRQERFTAAIVGSALSLANGGDGSFAWGIFRKEMEKGTLALVQRKNQDLTKIGEGKAPRKKSSPRNSNNNNKNINGNNRPDKKTY